MDLKHVSHVELGDVQCGEWMAQCQEVTVLGEFVHNDQNSVTISRERKAFNKI
jgi:hypothetical protein